MKADPVRLLDDSDLPELGRSLLVAGQACPLVEYDVAAGVGRFRTTLAGLGAAGVATTVASTARGTTAIRSTLVKLAAKVLLVALVPAVGVGVAVAVHRSRIVTSVPTVSAVTAPVADMPVDGNTREQPATAGAAPPPAGPTGTNGSPSPTTPNAALEAETQRGASDLRRTSARSHAGPAGRSAAEGTDPSGSVPTEHVVLEETPDPDEAKATSPSPARAASERREAAAPAAPATKAEQADAVHTDAPKPPAPAPRAESSAAVEEMQAIVHARNLVATDPNAALRALDDIRRQYPHGYFSEERRALTILALARAGNVALARQQATRFLSQYPNSPFADKVRAVAPPQTKR